MAGLRELVSLYALWGGMPRYWELAQTFGCDLDAAVDTLVLDPAGALHDEPDRLLRAETPPATSLRPLLDVIGAGAHRASEIGGRLGKPASSLARPLATLVAMNLVRRETPFGSDPKSGKRSFYRIDDPFLRLWFRVVAIAPGDARRSTRRDPARRMAIAIVRAWKQWAGRNFAGMCVAAPASCRQRARTIRALVACAALLAWQQSGIRRGGPVGPTAGAFWSARQSGRDRAPTTGPELSVAWKYSPGQSSCKVITVLFCARPRPMRRVDPRASMSLMHDRCSRLSKRKPDLLNPANQPPPTRTAYRRGRLPSCSAVRDTACCRGFAGPMISNGDSSRRSLTETVTGSQQVRSGFLPNAIVYNQLFDSSDTQ